MSAVEAPAMSPRDVAARWQCSERHVRNLIRRGRLRAFRLGDKLVRISREAVEAMDAEMMPIDLAVVETIPPPPTRAPKQKAFPVMNPAFSAVLDSVIGFTADEINQREAKGPLVYFIRSGDFVKIGWTTHLPTRLSAIMTSTPHDVEVMLCVKGGEELEGQLHRRFSALHHRHEWFRFEGELKEWMEARRG